MRRKTTELEQQLIKDNFKLTNKRYRGNHSEKVFYYEYQKCNEVIRLDRTRTKVIQVGIKNVDIELLSDIELEHLRINFWNLKNYAKELMSEQEKAVNFAKELYAEMQQDNTKKPMTFEELDELCKGEEKCR